MISIAEHISDPLWTLHDEIIMWLVLFRNIVYTKKIVGVTTYSIVIYVSYRDVDSAINVCGCRCLCARAPNIPMQWQQLFLPTCSVYAADTYIDVWIPSRTPTRMDNELYC